MHDGANGSGTGCTSCHIQHKGGGEGRTVAMYVGGRDKVQGMEANVFGMLGVK